MIGGRLGPTLSYALLGSIAAGGCECGGGGALGRLEPEIAVTPESLEFGDVPIGAVRYLSLEVQNTGGSNLELTGLDATIPFKGAFRETTVMPGARVLVDVAFVPVNDEPQRGVITITSNAKTNPMMQANLRGKGVSGNVSVRPDQVDFTNTPIGSNRSQELIVINRSFMPLSGRIHPEAFNRPEHYSLTGLRRFDTTGSLAVPARTDQTFDLSYRPLEAGDDGGRIIFEICGDRCGVEVVVRASAAGAVLRVDPPSIDFGGVGIGMPSTKTVLVVNSGQQVVVIRSLRVAAGPEVTGMANRELPLSLAPADSVAIAATYTPASASELQGELIVETAEGAASEVHVAISGHGEGPLFVVEPREIDFGVESSAGTFRRGFTLLNAGSSEVRIQRITLMGDPAFQLDRIPGLPARLGSGESLSPYVTFTPAGVREYRAMLTVESDDPATPQVTVPVVGGFAERYCKLEVMPGRVNFGLLPPGFSRRKSAAIKNVGSNPCNIMSGEFRAPIDPAFTVASNPWPLALAPDQSQDVFWSFSPTMEIESKGVYVLRTDDPVFPERQVSVVGSAKSYLDIFAQPNVLDFGSMRPGCNGATRNVSLYNAGTNAARIDAINFTTPTVEFTRVSAAPTPIDIAAGGVQQFSFRYAAADLGVDLGEVEFVIPALPYPIIVPIKGEGSLNPVARDQFQQVHTRSSDILFVVDNSCSMYEEQTSLASNFRAFIQAADTRNVDFHIGVTTTDVDRPDAGSLVGPVLTRATPGYEVEFQNQTSLGVFGSAQEQGLEAMLQAMRLSQTGQGHNKDLLRAGTPLVVVIISDEEDQSPAPAITYFNELRNRIRAGYLIAAITGETAGCSGPGGFAAPAGRYMDFLRLTGGISGSICSTDWANLLTVIGNAAFGLKKRFPLSQQADQFGSFEVRVDGNLQPQGTAWTYNAMDNHIYFIDGFVPQEGAIVDITYVPAC